MVAKANGESFPVLKAFQDYLEQERERARRRVLVLTLSFLGVLVALVVVFVVLFVSFFGVMLRNNDQQQVRMLSLLTPDKAVPVVQTVQPAPLPTAPAEAVQPQSPASEKPLTREDILSILRELKAEPAPAAPAAAEPAKPEAAPAVAPPAKKPTGVLSPVSKQETAERLRKEEEARKARAAERRRLAEEEAAAKAALAAAEQKSAEEEAPVAASSAQEAPAPGVLEPVRINRRPGTGVNVLPKGKESDTIYLQTRAGVIPFRSVLPTTSAGTYE